MTAEVRTHFTGRAIRPLTGFIFRSIKAQTNGDNPLYVRRPAGQLWQRLAEQEVVPTARLGAALIRADARGAVSS